MNNLVFASIPKTSSSGALNLTQKVDYGLFLLITLAKDKDLTPLSIQAIADRYHLSFSFLQKVAGHLKKAHLITSTRGKLGGYNLAKSPKNITLKEIIEALEGPINIMHCLNDNPGQSQCNRSTFCHIRSGLQKINEEIKKSLLEKNLQFFIS